MNLGALEKHLPGIFMCCVEEPGQSLVLCWVKFPQNKSLSLTREDPAEEHDLDYGDKFNLPVDQVFDAGLESGHLCELPHDRPVSFHEVSCVGMPDRNSEAASHSGSRGSVM